ncbi:ABC transporter ATP-binding protein, partial [Candidatus Altiarchaeota archaeon]
MSLSEKAKKREPIIDLKDVWKIYKMGEVEVPALRGLTLSIYPHEFLAVMGPSGSGKSTALNMIGCLDVPTRGDIYLSSENIAHLSESNLATIRGRKIGFVFQQFNLMTSLTAVENVALPMIFQGYSAVEREDRASHLLELVGLGDRMHHRPTELSGGQQQRVAIARSLANDPEVVLADEPTGNLDSKSSHEIIDMLEELHEKEKKTIIMVTHDPEISERAKRTVHLKD